MEEGQACVINHDKRKKVDTPKIEGVDANQRVSSQFGSDSQQRIESNRRSMADGGYQMKNSLDRTSPEISDLEQGQLNRGKGVAEDVFGGIMEATKPWCQRRKNAIRDISSRSRGSRSQELKVKQPRVSQGQANPISEAESNPAPLRVKVKRPRAAQGRARVPGKRERSRKGAGEVSNSSGEEAGKVFSSGEKGAGKVSNSSGKGAGKVSNSNREEDSRMSEGTLKARSGSLAFTVQQKTSVFTELEPQARASQQVHVSQTQPPRQSSKAYRQYGSVKSNLNLYGSAKSKLLNLHASAKNNHSHIAEGKN